MFENLKCENLFSWESLEYTFMPGVAQITGFNFDDGVSEGSGKSAILNSLCWVLYGKVPKNIKADEIIRHGQKEAKGEVTLTSGVVISRSRKPNDLVITKDFEQIREKDVKETQKLVNTIVGLDFECFCQTVYFAQNYEKRFITSSEAEKVRILSEIQNLDVYDRARDKAKADATKLDGVVQSLESELQVLLTELASAESQKELLREFIGRFEEDQESNAKKLSDRIVELSEQNSQLREIIASKRSEPQLRDELSEAKSLRDKLITTKALKDDVLSKYTLKMNSLREAKTQLTYMEDRKKSIEERISTLQTPTECPTCKGPISKEVAEKLCGEKSKLEEDLQKTDARVLALTKQVTEMNIEPFPELEQEVAELDRDIKHSGTFIRLLEEELTELRDATKAMETLDSEILSTSTQLEQVLAVSCEVEVGKLRKLDTQVEKASTVRMAMEAELAANKDLRDRLILLKDGFKQVKSYVFKEFLANLSTESSLMAQELFEVPIQIRFHNDSDNGGVSKILTEVTIDGIVQSLGLYSGGQARRIQLSVDLALAKLIGQRLENPINFRILDECMKDLALPSKEKVVELLRKLDGNSIIIEHDPVIMQIVENVTHVELRDGVSRIAQGST